jgi:hypothetical protein
MLTVRVDGRGPLRYNVLLACAERKAMARTARVNTSNPADGRLPSSDAKLKLNRLWQRQHVQSRSMDRQAALIDEARATRKAEHERKRTSLARRR